MTSKADDFDVRYRDARETGGLTYGRPGGRWPANWLAVTARYSYAGNIDYDLGYDANGWDTNGFRSPEGGYGPEAGYLDSHESGPARRSGRGGVGVAALPDDDPAPGGRREGSDARPAGTHEAAAHEAPAHEAPHEVRVTGPYQTGTPAARHRAAEPRAAISRAQ